MNRSKRKLIAEETLQIIDRGYYEAPNGSRVSLRTEIEAAVEGTRLFRPDDFDDLQIGHPENSNGKTEVEAFNETTFAGCRALLDAGAERVCCLNFASAKNPGGGFLGGSQAQEEALARASALYPCINQCQDYYEFHRRGQRNSLYSDHMIYSPQVPVFRDDFDRLLDGVWMTAIITSPAVNAGALQKNRPELVKQVEPVMRERISKVLQLAASQGETHLVLGAWGCGVFRNDPQVIAGLFEEELSSPTFRNRFERVRFSVLDTLGKQATFNAFAQRFKK